MIPYTLDGELLRRQLKRDYGAYVEYVNEGFHMTHFHRYLCDQIQEFLEMPPTGKAMDILLLSVPPQHGKAIGKDEPVWTPDGWRKHGDLKVGDRVYDAHGQIQTVTQVHPDYYGPSWRVTFKTGESILCSPQHLWNVCYTDRSKKQSQVITKTVETQDIYKQNRYLLERSPFVAVNNCTQGTDSRLPVHPYLLGAWLGDGYSHIGHICGQLEDLVEMFPYGDIYKTRENFGEVREVISTYILKDMELWQNKHIPVQYLTADETVRRKLLMGLMDTDGNISKRNFVAEICLANKQLAEDTYTLIRSLGYKAQIIERVTHNQNKDFEGKAYRVIFRPHNGDVLFKLSRKQEILDDYFDAPQSPVSSRYYIASVEPTGENFLANCITVTGDGTYLVGKDLIPTHNSYTVTETLPSWYLAKHPTDAVIICSYEGDFAERFSRRNRDKFNEYCTDIFGVQPNMNIQGVAYWETALKGACRAAGLKAGITGHGAELFIIDDPIKNKEQAQSETVISKIHAEMGPSVQSRIHPGGKLIVIQTRWVEDDVIGFILKNWKEFIWKYINLPCECEDETNDPLGRHVGDALMGEHLGDYNIPQKIRNDNKWLQSKKRLVMAGDGEYTWNALYQGHPSASNGNLFKDDWWQLYSRRDVRFQDFEYTCLSVDATFKKTETSDMVAIELWGLAQNHAWLYKLVNKRMGFVETVDYIKKICRQYPEITELVIEDKANGSAIIDTLRVETDMPPIVPVNPLGGKYSRAQAISPFVRTLSVHIPDDFTYAENAEIEWDQETEMDGTKKFVMQHTKFPFMAHDDMVDSCSQALARLIKLITGEEAMPERKYLRYTKWYPDMWDDYEQLNAKEQEEFIKTYGAPLEWAPDDYVAPQHFYRR